MDEESTPRPRIELPNDDGVTRKVLAEATVKWLGVYFDRKLLFNEHVKNMAAKADKAVSGMSMPANTIRGLSQKHYRQLYIACVRPILTYASMAWWTGKKTQEKKLERVQRRALREVVAAFCTTPIEAIEIEAPVPPIRLHLDQCARRAAMRLNKLSTRNPVIQCLNNRWRAGRNPSNLPPLPTHRASRAANKLKKTTQLQQITAMTDPKDERLYASFELTVPWRCTNRNNTLAT